MKINVFFKSLCFWAFIRDCGPTPKEGACDSQDVIPQTHKFHSIYFTLH